MASLFVQAYLSYKSLLHQLRWHAFATVVLVRPVMLVVLFAFFGRFAARDEAVQSYIVGMIAFAIPLVLLWGILQTFVYERYYFTLTVVLGSPANRAVVYFSRGVTHYPNALVAVAASLFFAWWLLELDISRLSWSLLVGAILLITLSCMTYSLFFGNFSIVFREWGTIGSITPAAFTLLTGVIIPTESLPAVLEGLSRIVPMTHGLVAMRAAFAGEAASAVGMQLVWELVVGAVYAVGGYALFRACEVYGRRTGAMETGVA